MSLGRIPVGSTAGGAARLYLSSYRLGPRPGVMRGARAAVVANAIDGAGPDDRAAGVQQELDDLGGLGLRPVEVDLREHSGDPAGLARRLAEHDVVWVRGGNVFVLRRALAASGADTVLVEMIASRSFVYAGYSAGVCVLAPTLRGLELVDDPTEVPAGYEADVVWDGLGVLPFCVVPHYRSDHPESEDVERVVSHYVDTGVPFVALRDGEAIVRDDAGYQLAD